MTRDPALHVSARTELLARVAPQNGWTLTWDGATPTRRNLATLSRGIERITVRFNDEGAVTWAGRCVLDLAAATVEYRDRDKRALIMAWLTAPRVDA